MNQKEINVNALATGMAMGSNRLRWTVRLAVATMLFLVSAVSLLAQSGGVLQGTITDVKGGLIGGASVTITNTSTGKKATTTADVQGHFSMTNVAAGTYNVEASATGFEIATRKALTVSADKADTLTLTLPVQGATDEISVDANETHSIAAALAPMDALLDERSARTEITQGYIANYLSPIADYGETIQMAPGAFTTNGNGVGLGQSKSYFRGFSDGSYDIDFDGLPFYDTNSPTHHSWAFFPSQWLGGVDFDRSPGTASTTGPTPFGGSIHLLSRELSPVQNLRGGISYGSFNTVLGDIQYDSGALGKARKLFMFVDGQHMQSKGYQTNNTQQRNAGSIKVQYKFSDKTVLTGFAGVVWVDANTPNFNATRCQLYGVQTGYTCKTGTGAFQVDSPYTGAGENFYLAPASDIYSGLSVLYNRYHIPTDFEYIGFKTVLPGNVAFEFKPYTYNYDNAEVYSNTVPITENTSLPGMITVGTGATAKNYYQGVQIIPCNGVTPAAGSTTAPSSAPCGVDKYNSYRKYGETLTFSKVTRPVIARAGLWYEWARTNRHQFPADPLQNYRDVGLPNFSENFWTSTYQPYAELEFHPAKKLTVVAGTKFAYTTIDTKQLPDNGKTIGNLCMQPVAGVACTQVPFISNHGSFPAWLPSLDGNYRIRSNWSVYAQLSTGSIVPPSNVYDYNQTISPTNLTPVIATPVKQQRSTTYQFGTVAKLKRVTLDMDYYHVKFQNSYTQSQVIDPVVFYLQPGSVSQGFEAETNVSFGHGLSAYFNATVGRAYYHGTQGVSCTAATGTVCNASTPQLVQTVPNGQWVANTPEDTEAGGVTYANHGFDVGFLTKRVGTMRQDDGKYHNQGMVDAFNVANMFMNYTIRSGSRFDQTKIKLSLNNLLDNHQATGLGLKGATFTQTVLANGASYVDQFTTTAPAALSGLDQLNLLPGRSVTISVTFGLSPKR